MNADRLTPQREAEIAVWRKRIADLLWWSVPSNDDAEAKATTEDLLDHLIAAVRAESAAELAAVRAERDEAKETVAFLERSTLPDLQRTVQHHQDGKKRWRDRAEKAEARLAELEKATEQIRFLHKDSPMGPCPVCVDADAMARGDDPTVPYPCPTARLAGAKDCDPPSHRTTQTAEETK
ncbi:hypothetical protein ABZX82_01680 [Streptomyces griseoflavus]|uniref:hypothetical protein n=1 Tax=Streptomyces griseoflavus TaxID=35619 RepID=UPI00339E50C8